MRRPSASAPHGRYENDARALWVKPHSPEPSSENRGSAGWAVFGHANQFGFLDLTGHAGRAVWLWQVGDDVSGKLGYMESLALASLANVQSGGVQSVVPNALTSQ